MTLANVVVFPHPLGLECLLPSPRASPLAPGAFSWQMQDSRALGSLHSLALLFLAKADWDKSMKALLPNHPVRKLFFFCVRLFSSLENLLCRLFHFYYMA